MLLMKHLSFAKGGIVALAMLCFMTVPSTSAFHEVEQEKPSGCEICLDDCPRRGLSYGDYFCYDESGNIDLTDERSRLKRSRIPAYMLKNRNDKTANETTLRRRFLYPQQPRSVRLAASKPTNGLGRFLANKNSMRADVSMLDKTTRSYMRGTLTEGYRRQSVPSQIVQVMRVIDAQTFTVRKADTEVTTVRLAGVVAPSYSQCLGQQVFAAMSLMLAQRHVTMTHNTEAVYQTYGHESVYFSLDGTDIASAMLQEGYAIHDNPRSHDKGEEYAEYELQAKIKQKGVWGSCQTALR